MVLVLIVDDSSFQRGIVRNIVRAGGHETLEANNGSECLKMVAIHTLDCILMDLLMPGLSGLGVLEALRDQGSRIPVVVLTADIQESTQRQCLELGASAFVNKPPNEDELLSTIKNVLDSSDDVAR